MKYLRLFALGAFAGVALLLWLERRDHDVDLAQIAAIESWEKDAHRHVYTLKVQLAGQVQTFTRWRTAWHTLVRVDTLRGDTVFLPITVIQAADSAIRSCAIALTTCQELAALQGARADSALRLAELYRHQARGPFLRPSAELLFAGSHPRAAAQLEAGRRLSAVARLEVDTLPRLWAGLRYQF